MHVSLYDMYYGNWDSITSTDQAKLRKEILVTTAKKRVTEAAKVWEAGVHRP